MNYKEFTQRVREIINSDNYESAHHKGIFIKMLLDEVEE